MSYGRYLASQPLFWALVVGLAIGVAVASIARPLHRARRPTRAAQRRWSTASLALSVAFASAALGIIVPEGLAIVSVGSAWAAGAGAATGFLALRFPRSVGIPLLLLLGSSVVLAFWMIGGYEPVRAQAELAHASVLSIRDDGISIELVRSDKLAPEGSAVMTVPGREVDFQADIVDLGSGWFFLGSTRFVRYRGPGDVSEAAANPLLERLEALGAARVEYVDVPTVHANLLRTYRFNVGPTGAPFITID